MSEVSRVPVEESNSLHDGNPGMFLIYVFILFFPTIYSLDITEFVNIRLLCSSRD